jgi:hypothetical protein
MLEKSMSQLTSPGWRTIVRLPNPRLSFSNYGTFRASVLVSDDEAGFRSAGGQQPKILVRCLHKSLEPSWLFQEPSNSNEKPDFHGHEFLE